jgi:Ras-related protein Rab-18
VILVYDICSRDSFATMERWYEEAENNAVPGAIMYLVRICHLALGAFAKLTR